MENNKPRSAIYFAIITWIAFLNLLIFLGYSFALAWGGPKQEDLMIAYLPTVFFAIIIIIASVYGKSKLKKGAFSIPILISVGLIYVELEIIIGVISRNSSVAMFLIPNAILVFLAYILGKSYYNLDKRVHQNLGSQDSSIQRASKPILGMIAVAALLIILIGYFFFLINPNYMSSLF